MAPRQGTRPARPEELMVKVTFISPAGEARTVEARPGTTVMEAAIANDISGIEAQCYGSCNCGTCHVYVAEGWMEATGPPKVWEAEMLQSISPFE